jgi:hypothetical protein
MVNVKTTIKGKILTIEVDLSERHGKSASGKTTVIATTQGNIQVDPNTGATLGLNVYTKQD